MKTYKSFIFFFAFVLSLGSLNAGVMRDAIVADSVPTTEDLIKLEKIEQKLTRSPHYKNPNAAGRLAVFNRTAPPAPEKTTERLTGPAYKNRKLTPTPVDSAAQKAATRPRLIGPRYKNRTAKSNRGNRGS